MAKKLKKGRVPRPEGRGTPHQKGRKGQSYAVRLGASVESTRLFLRRNRMVVKGCLIFAGCVLAFMLIHSWVLGGETLNPLFDFLAAATGSIANLFGASTQVNGSLISSPDFSMSIVLGCTAIIPIAIFLSAVLAYPCTLKQKATGMALGIAALFTLNLVRTVSLFFIGSHASRSFFDTAHFLIWQPVMILVAIVLWLFWVGKLTRVAPR